MNATAVTYEERAAQLQALEGEKVRLTYRGGTTTGIVSCKDYGHCVDVMLDGHGGQPFGQVLNVEVKRGARYVALESR